MLSAKYKYTVYCEAGKPCKVYQQGQKAKLVATYDTFDEAMAALPDRGPSDVVIAMPKEARKK